MANTVQIPADLFKKFLRAGQALDSFNEALEDFLISRNPKLLRELRKARSEHLSGKTRHWEEFKRQVSRSGKKS